MTIARDRKTDLSRMFRLFVAVGVLAGVQLESLAALAGTSSTTSTRYYNVSGTAKSTLARKMRNNPFRGDRGGAVANIRPKYTLKLATKKTANGCGISVANLKVRFILTLPKAKESAMAKSTRSSWRSFVSFARRHEQRHRSIYMQCARKFVAKAQRLSNSSCRRVTAQARKLLQKENAACEKRHSAFDRSERRRLSGLSLFRGTR